MIESFLKEGAPITRVSSLQRMQDLFRHLPAVIFGYPLFPKSEQRSNYATEQGDGLGIGLYIVKNAVDKLGGEIEVASAPEHVFIFSCLTVLTAH